MAQQELNSVLQRKVDDFVYRSTKDSNALIAKLQSRVIDDLVIPSKYMKFGATAKDVSLFVKEGNDLHDWSLTSHSAYQVADKLGLPQGWVSKAAFDPNNYKREAVSYALNQYMENLDQKDNRFLLRNVDGRVKGFLSTSYRRLNTREIFLMFLLTAQKFGLPVVGAFEGDSKDYLEILDPNLIYIDTPNNGLVAYARGMQLKNSDFGDGVLDLRSWGLHGVCLNGATGKSFLKERHLGSRLSDDFIFSIETINKDTETRALMVRDAMEFIFSSAVREAEEFQIKTASECEVDLNTEIKRLPVLGVNTVESKMIGDVIMKRDPEDGLYGKPSMWMMAQAISAISRKAEGGRKRELQQIAGNLVFTSEIAM